MYNNGILVNYYQVGMVSVGVTVTGSLRSSEEETA